MTSLKQKNKDKAAKKEVMAALKAKNAAAKSQKEAGDQGEGRASKMTVEFDATLGANASTAMITCNWQASPDMSCDEFRNMVREMFEASDENKNQKLTIDEFKQFTLYVLEAMQGINFSE